MGLVAKRVCDKRILRLIRGFLTAGVLADGLVRATGEGTPQGGPLSPLLSNLLLDDLDHTAATGSAVMPTTATSMCGRWRRGDGSWPR